MEIIKAMALSGCFIGVALCAADVIKPDEKFSAQIRLVFSAMFILAFLAPLKNMELSEVYDGSFGDSEAVYSGIGSAADEDMKYFIEKNTERAVMEMLKERGVEVDLVKVRVSIGDDSAVKVEEIAVAADNEQAVRRILTEEIGEDTVVEFVDGDIRGEGVETQG